MRKRGFWWLLALVFLASLIALGYWLLDSERVPGRAGSAPQTKLAHANHGAKLASRVGTGAMPPVSMDSQALSRLDPRLIALLPDELDWMARHHFLGESDLAALSSLDVDALDGTRDARLATMQGLALLQRGDSSGMAVLFAAGAMGSLYGYEEAALAQHRELKERLGWFQDHDDMLMAHLEVARMLGDYKVDALVAKHLPGYPTAARARIVQTHATEFLRQLGISAQMRGMAPPVIDPRPAEEQWRDLQRLNAAGASTSVDVYVAQ